MEDRSVVLLDGGHPIDKVYHTQHQVLRSGFVWVLPGDRLQDCRESRRAASAPYYIAAVALARLATS